MVFPPLPLSNCIVIAPHLLKSELRLSSTRPPRSLHHYSTSLSCPSHLRIVTPGMKPGNVISTLAVPVTTGALRGLVARNLLQVSELT